MQNGSSTAAVSQPKSGNRLPQPAANGKFVINLSASNTPEALVQPSHPDLQGFTFFVSRRREDRRERFRLHMGYFHTQEDAEKLLAVVREIFPAAWAGVAPGQRLRAGTEPPEPLRPAMLEAAPVAAAVPAIAASVIPANLELVVEPALPAKSEIPELPVKAAAPAQQPAALKPKPSRPASAAATTRPAASRPATTTPARAPEAPAKSLPTLAAPAAANVQQVEKLAAVESLDSVRAAIASLEDSARSASQQLEPHPEDLALLSDTQTLKLLEQSIAAPEGAGASRGRPAIAGFAVQLKWSVQPIDPAELPSLAIFDAYTLYCAEGNRDGRRWYALRLGFFSDSASAKQVAHYVRSEFDSVAVVPITGGERERARQAAMLLAPPTPVPAPSKSGEFRLIDDAVANAVIAPAPAPAPTPAAAPAATTAEPSNAALGSRRPPMSLEETLEVLGANDLKVDHKRGDLLNKSTARALHHAATRKEPQRSKLGKLFERLSRINQ